MPESERLGRLSERYENYHRAKRSSTFVFGGDERGQVFASLVAGPGKRVLDLGCRFGALTQAYADGNDVTGVDVDREALAEAAKLGIDTHHADVEEPLPFEDESFDVVVAGELLEHLRDPRRVVGEIRRVLRPGGRFVGSVPNFFRLRNRLLMLVGRRFDHDPTHLQIFAPQDVRALLGDFDGVELRFISSRFLRLSPRLFANIIVFTATKKR
jgi:methionine biosynthesis protein MetW